MQEIEKIISGYKRFQEKYFKKNQEYKDLVKHGQKPKTLIIACSDSRVDPAIIFDCDPGELFVVRNVANLVPPYESGTTHHATSAALEYGVKSLNVQNIIILGHSHCGGIETLMLDRSSDKTADYIDFWIDIAKAAKDHVEEKYPDHTIEEKTHYCEKESLGISLNNLLSFPWIRERVENNTLFLHGWYFDMERGIIESYSSATNEFLPI